MTKKIRQATFTLIADILTASTIGFLTASATQLLQNDWPIAIIGFVLALLNGCATIYFRQQV